MNEAKTALNWAIGIANDNSHGYSQQNRWGPDYDCSSLVISAFETAGVHVKRAGASYTGNMRPAFLRCGFKDVTKQINLRNGNGMLPGDVLLNIAHHTAMYIGNGRVVHARSSEGNSQQGDQSGNEIRTQPYWNYPWDCVLRYSTDTAAAPVNGGTEGKPATPARKMCSVNLPELSKGCKGEDVRMLQLMLINRGFGCGICGADGEFGYDTQNAVERFQKANGLVVDSIVGAQTWQKLLGV